MKGKMKQKTLTGLGGEKVTEQGKGKWPCLWNIWKQYGKYLLQVTEQYVRYIFGSLNWIRESKNERENWLKTKQGK